MEETCQGRFFRLILLIVSGIDAEDTIKIENETQRLKALFGSERCSGTITPSTLERFVRL